MSDEGNEEEGGIRREDGSVDLRGLGWWDLGRRVSGGGPAYSAARPVPQEPRGRAWARAPQSLPGPPPPPPSGGDSGPEFDSAGREVLAFLSNSGWREAGLAAGAGAAVAGLAVCGSAVSGPRLLAGSARRLRGGRGLRLWRRRGALL